MLPARRAIGVLGTSCVVQRIQFERIDEPRADGEHQIPTAEGMTEPPRLFTAPDEYRTQHSDANSGQGDLERIVQPPIVSIPESCYAGGAQPTMTAIRTPANRETALNHLHPHRTKRTAAPLEITRSVKNRSGHTLVAVSGVAQ